LLWGEGTGGHLAALLGTRGPTGAPVVLEDVAIAGVIDWYGPTDLLWLTRFYSRCHDPVLVAAAYRFLGCNPQMCVSTADAANPSLSASAGDPPFLIMHGVLDCRVTQDHSGVLRDALAKAQADVTYRLLPLASREAGVWHSDDVNGAVDEFVNKVLPDERRRRPARH
jgi:hypothetical protein